MDYQTVYSQFRILKARLDISRARGNDAIPAADNYLIVPSRAFALAGQPIGMVGQQAPSVTWSQYVPDQTEDALRQTRWQKVLYPSAITQKVHTSFKPYTMTAGFGPVIASHEATGTGVIWPRIWEGYKWMPFKWANTTATTGLQVRLAFFGPYLVQNVIGTGGSTAFPTTLTLYVQFRGQK